MLQLYHPEHEQRLHVFYMLVWLCSKRTVFNKYHAFSPVCRAMTIEIYRNLKSSSRGIYTYLSEAREDEGKAAASREQWYSISHCCIWRG